MQDSVEVPDAPGIEAGLSVHVRPLEGVTVAVRVTVPVNPLMGDTVIVEVPAMPAVVVTLVGLTVTVKLGGTRRMWIEKVLWKVNVKKT